MLPGLARDQNTTYVDLIGSCDISVGRIETLQRHIRCCIDDNHSNRTTKRLGLVVTERFNAYR